MHLHISVYIFRSPYCPPNQQIKDEDAESGKGPSLPHSPHTVEGYISPTSQDSDSDGGLSLDQFRYLIFFKS